MLQQIREDQQSSVFLFSVYSDINFVKGSNVIRGKVIFVNRDIYCVM